MAAKKTSSGKKRRRKQAPKSHGIEAKDSLTGNPPAEVEKLRGSVADVGGVVLSTYREPLAGRWLVLASLPIDAIDPTPYQRDLSDTHMKRLSGVIDKTGRFLDPVVAVTGEGGKFWTPNGLHRLEAMRRLGAKAITALIVPEPDIAFQILALNTEKAHNLKERSLEVIRMYRALLKEDDRPETGYAFYFEDPSFITLGPCYEKNLRFSGGAYHSVLRKVEAFLDQPLAKAIKVREERARKVESLEEAVVKVVEALKARGFQSPYLRAFVVARINPLRWTEAMTGDFDETLDTMIERARKFDASKVKQDDLARTAGGASSAE